MMFRKYQVKWTRICVQTYSFTSGQACGVDFLVLDMCYGDLSGFSCLIGPFWDRWLDVCDVQRYNLPDCTTQKTFLEEPAERLLCVQHRAFLQSAVLNVYGEGRTLCFNQEMVAKPSSVSSKYWLIRLLVGCYFTYGFCSISGLIFFVFSERWCDKTRLVA